MHQYQFLRHHRRHYYWKHWRQIMHQYQFLRHRRRHYPVIALSHRNVAHARTLPEIDSFVSLNHPHLAAVMSYWLRHPQHRGQMQ